MTGKSNVLPTGKKPLVPYVMYDEILNASSGLPPKYPAPPKRRTKAKPIPAMDCIHCGRPMIGTLESEDDIEFYMYRCKRCHHLDFEKVPNMDEKEKVLFV